MKIALRGYVVCLLMGAFSGAAEPAQPFTNAAAFTNRGIMMYGDRSPNGPRKTKDQSVVKFKGQYSFNLSVPLDERLEGWQVAVATSDDLLTWEKVLTMESEHPSEANGFCAPGAIVLGNRVHLFHQTYGIAESDAICHARSDDGKYYLFYQGHQDGRNSWCLSKVEIGRNGSRPFVMPRPSINDPGVPNSKA
jgi:hypothetical protein